MLKKKNNLESCLMKKTKKSTANEEENILRTMFLEETKKSNAKEEENVNE